MATMPRYPSLFQINTRVWLQRLSREAGRPVTLADVNAATIDRFAEQGFAWIWLLSVWQIGTAGRAVSRGNSQWRAEFKAILPDLTEDDICGSGFAITAYTVSDAVGGEIALAQFREKLAKRGIKLMLDFVPNHTALDHPWVKATPSYYVQGTEATLAEAPGNYVRTVTNLGPSVLSHGRDPNFPGWPDTLQLNYANPKLQIAQIDELTAMAGKCDGVRCDMAMLMLPEIFQRTWGLTPEPFWPRATAAVGSKHPGFTFMAEVYWDLEWTLQQQGFDYCYDKRLYDRLRDGHVGADGANPTGSLIADANGNLFGTTGTGGANGDGTVFEIAKTSHRLRQRPHHPGQLRRRQRRQPVRQPDRRRHEDRRRLRQHPHHPGQFRRLRQRRQPVRQPDRRRQRRPVRHDSTRRGEQFRHSVRDRQ